MEAQRNKNNDIAGHIVPWALPKENIPVYVELPKSFTFDEIHIKIPPDLEFIDFLNVESVRINGQIVKINKLITSKSEEAPIYFGFIIRYKEIPKKLKIARKIIIEFYYKNRILKKLELEARIFRPKIEVTDAIEKIELTDEIEKVKAPINLKYIGFGDVKLKIEAEIRGKIVSHGESIIYELLRRLWLSDVLGIEREKEKEDKKRRIHVEPDFIREISEQIEKKIESGDISGILDFIDEKDIEDFKRWLSDVKTKKKFMGVIYSRIEDLLLDLLADLLERHPTESVKLASSQTKIKTKIELPIEIITIRLKYTDKLGNEYPPVEIPIRIEDKRVKKKGTIIEIPIVIEKWEEEPFMNVAEMEIKEED